MVARYLYDKWDTDDGVGFGLPILARIIGTTVKGLTPDSIENWLLAQKGDVPKIRKKLQPFYDAIEKGAAEKEWAKYNTPKQKNKQEKVQSPLAYHLVDWLNELYSEHLTSLMHTFRNIVQVNVDLDTRGKLSVTVKSFPEINFIFSNAGNSTAGRNKIGFKKGK